MKKETRMAFTLIELLVVIAVIAILAAILFPVFAKAREKARQTSCASNMKQLGLAHLAYAEDYDETFGGIRFQKFDPPYLDTAHGGPCTFYTLYLEPYIKSPDIYICPSGESKPCCFQTLRRSYHMNLSLVWWTGIQMAAITSPASTIIMADAGTHHLFGDGADYGFYYGNPPPGAAAGAQYWDYDAWPWIAWRHNGGANILWVDGHVKWMKANTIDPKTLHPNQ